ncbi:polygalacturonase inhibitor-like [Phragmites australis]|uniref:polygalacturonase inhibitor-like n=1 Tax=Phragmites australis TaxID=29695 RepID=UPI002D78D220|nr:polygalacturonase inhibitor-like [Phragmites australis]
MQSSPKMKTTALLVLLLLTSLLAAASSNKDRCHPADKAALLAIKAALGNPYHFASWTPDTPCCDWYDVDCDPSTGRVVGLSVFQDANLTGTIPDAIAGLVHLQNLMLHHLPAISGPIPPAIAKLSNLSLLIISYTGVSGPVPSFLGKLTALTLLDLSFNSLTGAIPASLADLPSLSSIDLSRNRLTGSLPPLLFSKAPQEAYLRLSHNNLSGTIPAEFAAVSFAEVDLSRNAFTGDASGLFGRAKALQHLDLSRNAFSFDLSVVELPEQLDSVDLSHNAIYGGIPAQVANLSNLQFFNVSYNRLCGAVPTGGNMARFDAYCYQHNKCLCGTPLPPCN